MTQNLEDLSPESFVFIDSNIFIYEFSSHPKYGKSCKHFLEKIEETELLGATSVTVLDEVLYKSMLIELSNKENINVGQASTTLRDKPQKIQNLSISISNVKDVLNMPILVLGTSPNIFENGIKNIKKHNLRPHDASILETLKFHNIENIATNDQHFKSIKDLNVYEPTELNKKDK